MIHLTIGEGEFHERLHDATLTQIPVLSEAASEPSFVVFTLFSFLEEIAVFFAFDTETIRYSLFEILGIVRPWAITYTVLTFIYAWVPNTKAHIKAILPVALVATVAFEVVKHVFAVYLQLNARHLLSIFGSLAAVIMFFIFVYVEAIIMLAGTMLCAQWTEYLKTRNQQRLFDPQEFRTRSFAARLRLIRGAKS